MPLSSNTEDVLVGDDRRKAGIMLAPETVLQDRYRIVRQLGQGGMGAVYEAIDLRLDATVALKETLFVDEKLRKQFEREARLLARLHHPALPRVSDHFAEVEGAFLVMQYIQGDDLAEMIARRRGPFPIEQVLVWGDQLLDALDYLHTQEPQIIHRDIKPQNLKLSARGQIILLDFGLAKGQVGELSQATTSVSIFGYTPNYAPLEQIQGLGTDSRSDIYALAATLYHLATGVKPPDALTRAAAIVNGQPDPLQRADQVNPAVNAQVAAVLQRAMAQNREQRYSTATEMRNAFHAGQQETIEIGVEAATMIFPQEPTRLDVAIPTATAGAAGIAQTGVIHSGETTVLHPPARSTRLGKPLAVAGAVVLFAGVAFCGFYAYQHRAGIVPASNPALPAAAVSPTPSHPSAPGAESGSGQTGKSTAEVKKPESTNPAPTKKEAATKETVAKKPEKPAEPKPASRGDGRADAKPPATPDEDDPDEDSDTRGRRNGRGNRMPGGIRVMNRPNGTRVMVAPDGTRIVTMPDGTTRVFNPPGQRRRRKP
jgi:serine/threonine protein kinase